MSKNCLIYETLNSTDQLQHHKSADGLMHLTGVFGVCGVRNNNSRIYEQANYAKMVAEMKKRIQESKGIAGELEHPSTMNITLDNISHKIVDINIDENGVVSGEIALLDTPKGQVAQKIVEGGLPLFISSRAQGQVDQRTGVVTLESLATYDLVGSPGFSQAKLHLNESQLNESIQEMRKKLKLNESQKLNVISDSNVVFITESDQANENNNNADMDKELQEKFESMEARLNALEEENQALKDQLDAVDEKQIDVEKLAESIQRWVIEELSPEIQKWMLTEAKSEMSGKLDKDTLMKISEGIQTWILNDYSNDVQKWILEDYSQGIQQWIIKELAPSMEQWITENQVSREDLDAKITESLAQYKNDKMSQINETLQLLESMEPKAKPAYQRQNPQQQQKINEGMPKYLAEMPDSVRVKYELASKEIRESIDRRARLYDFTTEGAIEKFWNRIDFDNIQGTKNIYEGLESIQDEKERAIRAQFRRFRANH